LVIFRREEQKRRMLIVETIHKIRMAHHRQGKSIRQIAKDFNLSRNTVRKVLRTDVTEFSYAREAQPLPKLGPYEGILAEQLTMDALKPKKQRRTGVMLFEELQRQGYEGGYDSVRRYIKRWKKAEQSRQGVAYIPLSFAPGEAFQFDWSYEMAEVGGELVKLRVAHFRLCYSRMTFCVAYLREALEMVIDSHVRAFEFFGGVCRKGIYDNLKTVVSKILLGKDRNFNRRFQCLASHYLFETIACTPAAGWEKGQVENQVKTIRYRMFVPRLKFADMDELNKWLSDRCWAIASGQKHPEFQDKTVAEYFEEERASLMSVSTKFEGYRETPVRVSSTSLVSYDSNRYSVHASAVGKTAMIRAYADKLVIVHDGEVIGEHRRQFCRNRVFYDAWHYLDVLKYKPGALRNGAPFKDWRLPEPLTEIREVLGRHNDGDRQFVGILGAISTYGLDEVAKACAEAVSSGAVSKDVVLNILFRNHDHHEVSDCEMPPHLPELKTPPLANCGRYDELLSGGTHAQG
jgi:transposase